MGKWLFWSEIGSGFGKLGGTPLPRIHRSTPRSKLISWKSLINISMQLHHSGLQVQLTGQSFKKIYFCEITNTWKCCLFAVIELGWGILRGYDDRKCDWSHNTENDSFDKEQNPINTLDQNFTPKKSLAEFLTRKNHKALWSYFMNLIVVKFYSWYRKSPLLLRRSAK